VEAQCIRQPYILLPVRLCQFELDRHDGPDGTGSFCMFRKRWGIMGLSGAFRGTRGGSPSSSLLPGHAHHAHVCMSEVRARLTHENRCESERRAILNGKSEEKDFAAAELSSISVRV
jgi:hypothetical protein